MPSRLIMIAHAETEATRRAAFPDGESLNQKGLKAGRDQWMAMPKRDASFASPAPAARETASALGLQGTVEDDLLRELDVGRWRGRTLAEIASAEPEKAANWIADPAFEGHGGESIVALVERMASWLSARSGEPGTIIAVTHAALLRAAMVAILDAPASAFWRIDIKPLSMLTLSSDGTRWIVRELRH